MSHEPECDSFQPFSPSLKQVCICAAVNAAYRRGVEAQEPLSHFPDSWSVLHTGSPAFLDQWAGGLSHNDYKRLRDYIDMVLRVTYRNGYNDHARSREIGLEMYGYVQHGKGENP